MKQYQYIKLLMAMAAACLLIIPAACSPKVDDGGYISENDIKTQISAGQSKEDVRTKLGSPSSQSSFGDETWYYITNRKQTVAFLRPEVVQQDITRIVFDTTGVVSKVETYNKDNGTEFDIAKRTTPTEGHTLGFFEQVLGNIGRFNRPGNASATPGRRPGG